MSALALVSPSSAAVYSFRTSYGGYSAPASTRARVVAPVAFAHRAVPAVPEPAARHYEAAPVPAPAVRQAYHAAPAPVPAPVIAAAPAPKPYSSGIVASQYHAQERTHSAARNANF